ncbi:Uncharacterized protein dnm_048220 [Desulfonema magnum]|uniref:Uncharacterized protein n=1 Tax=Desulfonema magnum TaxID=45655 RepID=A0A975BNM5_9BACT|nr:Uncharacterized protein dnm_048220 [Desulfonema magnum]
MLFLKIYGVWNMAATLYVRSLQLHEVFSSQKNFRIIHRICGGGFVS